MVPQGEVDGYEFQRLSSAVNALISVRLEKGVLSRAELADMLLRIS